MLLFFFYHRPWTDPFTPFSASDASASLSTFTSVATRCLHFNFQCIFFKQLHFNWHVLSFQVYRYFNFIHSLSCQFTFTHIYLLCSCLSYMIQLLLSALWFRWTLSVQFLDFICRFIFFHFTFCLSFHCWFSFFHFTSSAWTSDIISSPLTSRFHRVCLHHVLAAAHPPELITVMLDNACDSTSRATAFQKHPRCNSLLGSAENTCLVYFWRKPYLQQIDSDRKSNTRTAHRIRSSLKIKHPVQTLIVFPFSGQK